MLFRSSLLSNGVDWVRLLQKIPMQLRGTNFCTSSTRFAPSFVRQTNGPKCTQIVGNETKHEFRVQWGGSGAFVVKNSNATLFCSEIGKATKWSQMHPNGTRIPMQLRGTNFCTSSAHFAPSLVRQPNGSKCTQMV